ncbi:PEGA domain-containing protein [Candidatus Dojkabacteria bacterium]|nr:PEGA domain-containing protein [Candidatus Dojkabacteria bacterium]
MVPPLLIAGTILVYLVSKGYWINFSNGEIERNGVLTFTTTPRRATIFLDGENIGKSPRAEAGVKEGEHTIRIEKDGYYSWEHKVTVKAEQSIPIETTLFLKKPKVEKIFPSDEQDDKTEVENLFFDPERKMAVFTVKDGEKIQIWSYTINRRFWEFQHAPKMIAVYPDDFVIGSDEPYDLEGYFAHVSENLQWVLFTTVPTDTNIPTRRYLLQADSENSKIAELEIPIELTDENRPDFTGNFEYIIFQNNNELRSYNFESEVQSVIDTKTDNQTFTWTTDTDGLIYITKEDETGYSVLRSRVNGEDKTILYQTDWETDEIGNAEDTEYVDNKITEMNLTKDSKHLVIFTNKSILIYSFDKSETEEIDAQNPGMFTPNSENTKFLYTHGMVDEIYQYTLEVEEGDPIHTVGSKLIKDLSNEFLPTQFQWDLEARNIFYVRQDNTQEGESDEDTETEIVAISTENNKSYSLFNAVIDIPTVDFALGNSGSFLVTICKEDNSLCKVTIHE